MTLDSTSPAAPSTAPIQAPRRRLEWFLLGLVALGCVMRLVEVWVHNPMNHLFSDPLRHWDHGRDPLSWAPMVVFDSPLFQMWMSLLQKWSLAIPELVFVWVGALSVLTPWVWYRFLRETLSSRQLALTGWVVFAWLPSWFGIYDYFMSETLFLPLMGASLYYTMRARRKLNLSSFLLMVLLWTLTGLTRGIALPLAGAAGIWVWCYHPQKWRCILGSLLIALVALGPFAWRNHYYVGLWSPIGNPYLNQIYAESGKQNILLHLRRDGAEWGYVFGSPSLYSPQFEPLSSWTSKREGTVEFTIDLRRGSHDWEAALATHRINDFGQRLSMRVENFFMVMAGISWPDNNPEYFSGRMSNNSRWLWLPLLLIVGGLSARYWRHLREQPLLALLIAVWLGFQAFSLVVPNEGRYRKPLEGLLLAQALLLADLAMRRHRTQDTPPALLSSERPNHEHI